MSIKWVGVKNARKDTFARRVILHEKRLHEDTFARVKNYKNQVLTCATVSFYAFLTPTHLIDIRNC